MNYSDSHFIGDAAGARGWVHSWAFLSSSGLISSETIPINHGAFSRAIDRYSRELLFKDIIREDRERQKMIDYFSQKEKEREMTEREKDELQKNVDKWTRDFLPFRFGYVIYTDINHVHTEPVCFIHDTEHPESVNVIEKDGNSYPFNFADIFDHCPTDKEISDYLVDVRNEEIDEIYDKIKDKKGEIDYAEHELQLEKNRLDRLLKELDDTKKDLAKLEGKNE